MTAGGGQTDGQAQSGAPLCLASFLPASLSPLPSLEPPVLAQPLYFSELSLFPPPLFLFSTSKLSPNLRHFLSAL